jgi:hypothetical protein
VSDKAGLIALDGDNAPTTVEGVYRAALTVLKISHEGVAADALPRCTMLPARRRRMPRRCSRTTTFSISFPHSATSAEDKIMSLTRNGFQSFVNTQNPPGNVGDFASMNPRAVVPAGPNALKAGSGVTVGYFARADLSTGLAEGVVSPGSGILGFVANELQTVITAFLGQSSHGRAGRFPGHPVLAW